MNSGSALPKSNPVRQHKRFPYPPELSVSYEGHGESVHLSGPNISTQGMFINTPTRIPEGAVLTVRFRLHRINYMVTARCEVRYCLPGVGVGVEFVALAPETHDAIEREFSDNGS
jgi:hypothetical protein